jgi:hypothetical protein
MKQPPQLVAFSRGMKNGRAAMHRSFGIAAMVACASACGPRPAPTNVVATPELNDSPSPAALPEDAPTAISAKVREIRHEGGRESIPDALVIVDLRNPSTRPCHVHQIEMSWDGEGRLRQSIPELVVPPGGVATAQLRVRGPASIGLTAESARVDTDGICGMASLSIMLVDEGHAFMKALVGEVTAKVSAPVRSGIDRWNHPESGTAYEDPFLEADDPEVLRTYLAELGSIAVPDAAHTLAVGPSTDARWRTYYLKNASTLGGDISTAARVVRDPLAGPTMVEVELEPKAADQLRELTRRHVGKKMALLLDGKVMVATIIQSTIVGPKVTISAGDAAQAEALVARLRAHRQSPPSR